jgi:hypothetical protein
LNSIERKFGDMFEKEPYIRVKTFLRLVRRYFRDPFFAASEEFEGQVEDSLEKLPREREDLQAMAFYCWLRAKMHNRNYYKVLLETANEEEPVTE